MSKVDSNCILFAVGHFYIEVQQDVDHQIWSTCLRMLTIIASNFTITVLREYSANTPVYLAQNITFDVFNRSNDSHEVGGLYSNPTIQLSIFHDGNEFNVCPGYIVAPWEDHLKRLRSSSSKRTNCITSDGCEVSQNWLSAILFMVTSL